MEAQKGQDMTREQATPIAAAITAAFVARPDFVLTDSNTVNAEKAAGLFQIVVHALIHSEQVRG